MVSTSLVLRRARSYTIFVMGLLVVSLGVIAGFRSRPYWSASLLSIGASIIASVIVWWLTPANEELYAKLLSMGIDDVYQSRDDVEPRRWVQWLRQATRTCVMLGTSHSKWCTDADFRGALEERLRNGVHVKIFFLDPTSPAAQLRSQEEDIGRDTVAIIRSSINVLWKIRTGLPAELQGRLKLYSYRATPSMGVTWVDEKLMVVSHILAGSMNVTSPCLMLEPGRYGAKNQGLYETYAKNIKSIEDKFSTPITEANVHEYSPQQ